MGLDWSQVRVDADGEVRPVGQTPGVLVPDVARLAPSWLLPPEEPITGAQRRLGPLPVSPATAEDFFRVARWWELEAARGYGSARRSLGYARNMLAAAQARVEDGTRRPWTPGRDVAVVECGVCGGPVDGLWGCGGPVLTATKNGRTARCAGGTGEN